MEINMIYCESFVERQGIITIENELQDIVTN